MAINDKEIDDAIARNIERKWVVGVQNKDLIVQNFEGRGAIKINAEEWDDLKLVIDALIPGVKYA